MGPASFLKVALFLWASSIPVQGQIHATCTNTSFIWSYNSQDVNPCQMGEALGGVCKPAFTIQPLPADYYYSGVSGTAVTPCVCNTVYYTLLSLCGLCQNAFADRFDIWSANCTTTYTSVFPSALPSGFRLPHYAFLALDPTNKTIDLKALQADTGPENTGAAITRTATSTSRRPTNTLQNGGGDDDPSFSSDGLLKDAAKKIGIIAGCVVAGVWVIWAIGAAIVWSVCRRNSRRMYGTPSQMYQGATYASVPPSSPPPTGTGMLPPSLMGEKVYNPNDPSTFPQVQPTLGHQQSYTTSDRTSAAISTATTPSYQPYQPQPPASPDNSSLSPPNSAGLPNPHSYTISPDGTTTLAPPGTIQNPYQQVFYNNTGSSYGDPHKQAYTSGVPQI